MAVILLQDAVSHTLRFAALILLLGVVAGTARGDDAAVLNSQNDTLRPYPAVRYFCTPAT